MPTLPLPPLDNGVPIDGGDLPVSSGTDVAAEWANEIQEVPIDPIRDAIQCGQTAVFLEYQRRSSYAAAQSDATRATDEYLDDILEENGCPRKNGQTDDQARAVMFATPPVISPNAIIAVANGILAPFTNISCRYAEMSDGWFLGISSSPWSSHVYGVGHDGTPNYPDRPVSVLRRPPGAMPNFDTHGRWFLLRAPDISSLNSKLASVFNGLQNEPNSGKETVSSVGGLFVGTGVNVADDNVSYIFEFASETVNDVYNAVIASVNQAIGFSVRWDLSADPTLSP
jgi:hypothetical protein